jgi:hypothetical protein
VPPNYWNMLRQLHGHYTHLSAAYMECCS